MCILETSTSTHVFEIHPRPPHWIFLTHCESCLKRIDSLHATGCIILAGSRCKSPKQAARSPARRSSPFTLARLLPAPRRRSSLALPGMAGDASGAETYTTDEALSRLGFGRFQALLLGFLGTGWVAEAMEVMLLSFVGPSMKEEWGVSGAAEGLITSVVFAGMLLGACVGGLGSDRYGRRYVLTSLLQFFRLQFSSAAKFFRSDSGSRNWEKRY